MLGMQLRSEKYAPDDPWTAIICIGFYRFDNYDGVRFCLPSFDMCILIELSRQAEEAANCLHAFCDKAIQFVINYR